MSTRQPNGCHRVAAGSGVPAPEGDWLEEGHVACDRGLARNRGVHWSDDHLHRILRCGFD